MKHIDSKKFVNLLSDTIMDSKNFLEMNVIFIFFNFFLDLGFFD